MVCFEVDEKNHKSARFDLYFGAIVCVILLFICNISAVAAQKSESVQSSEATRSSGTVLKVAYCPLANFFDYNDQGQEVGYGVEVLDKISQYTGIDFQYIKTDSWEETKEMLLDGRADVRMPGTLPSTPSETLDYSKTSILDTYEVMLTLKSRQDLYYQDYDKIRSLKIAIVDTFYAEEEVEQYLSDIGVKKDQFVFSQNIMIVTKPWKREKSML